MKAVAVIIILLLSVFLLFATIGAPQYSDANGTVLSTSGTTIFDSWNYAQQERTERTRIEQLQKTQRTIIEQEEATRRNADFWQMFPLTVTALALCILAVAAGIFAWRWHPATGPRQITINHYAPAQLREYAAELGIPDAEYQQVGGRWLIVDPVAQRRYEPPPRLALLE